MDVTYGLLSSLVKTRSIQRVLSPIASQISLLIILNESEDGTQQMLHGEMVPCAKTVMLASHKLATVAKQHAETSSDQEFKAQTVSACEVLELSSSNLYIASERLEASNSSREARSKLVQASKDVLQGTMKVLLVADDAEIRRLITAVHIVTEKLSALDICGNMKELVHKFKDFTNALAVMTGICDKRQRDLIHSRQRERIITAMNILKKSISSLSIAMQNSVKYSHNPQAQIRKRLFSEDLKTSGSSSTNLDKIPKDVRITGESFVWAKVGGVPKGVLWPVMIKKRISVYHFHVYIRSDNAILTVECKDVVPFQDNTSEIKQATIEKLKNRPATLKCFEEDFEWAAREVEFAFNRSDTSGTSPHSASQCDSGGGDIKENVENNASGPVEEANTLTEPCINTQPTASQCDSSGGDIKENVENNASGPVEEANTLTEPCINTQPTVSQCDFEFGDIKESVENSVSEPIEEANTLTEPCINTQPTASQCDFEFGDIKESVENSVSEPVEEANTLTEPCINTQPSSSQCDFEFGDINESVENNVSEPVEEANTLTETCINTQATASQCDFEFGDINESVENSVSGPVDEANTLTEPCINTQPSASQCDFEFGDIKESVENSVSGPVEEANTLTEPCINTQTSASQCDFEFGDIKESVENSVSEPVEEANTLIEPCINSPPTASESSECDNLNGGMKNYMTETIKETETLIESGENTEHSSSEGESDNDYISVMPCSSRYKKYSESDQSESEYVECSDLEECTDVGASAVHGPVLDEKYKSRDINLPDIYIRKLRKSAYSSNAQAARKKAFNKRVYDNYHACLYCGVMVQHIDTHLRNKKHRKIPDVKRLLEEEKPDFLGIQKLGDHKHNVRVLKEGRGELILRRRPSTYLDVREFGPCPECKQWILLKNLKQHYRNCATRKSKVKKGQLIVQSQVLAGVISTRPSKLMLQEVFPIMTRDDIGTVAQNDPLIVALGESWLRRSIDNEAKRKYYTSQHMRLMARLLIELRKADEKNAEKALDEFIRTKYYDALMAATIQCCMPYMDDEEDLKSPSNAIKLKYDLIRVVNAKWALLVQDNPHSLHAEEMMKFDRLISVQWGERVTKLARAVLVRRRFKMKKELPSPEDVMKLTKHIVSELESTALTPENFFRIVQLVQTRLLLYNKRRSGEIDAVSLESFAGKTKEIDDLDQSMLGELTKVEQYLLKTQEMMIVRGKGNRPVPVLIPGDAKEPLEYIASWQARQSQNIPAANKYLFPINGLTHMRAYDSLKRTCSECCLTAPSRITSVSMRKYTATLSQVLNLDPYQVEWLCRHLGHSADIHKSYYRHMSGFVERVQLSKLFLVQDLNMTSKYRGKNLEEIDISDLIFPDSENVEEGNEHELEDVLDETDVTTSNIDEVVFQMAESDSDAREDEDEDEDEDEEEVKRSRKQKRQVIRQKWDEIEMKEIEQYFRSYLDAKVCPRKKAVELAKKQSKNRNGKIWRRTNDKIVKKISALNHKK